MNVEANLVEGNGFEAAEGYESSHISQWGGPRTSDYVAALRSDLSFLPFFYLFAIRWASSSWYAGRTAYRSSERPNALHSQFPDIPVEPSKSGA
jgi:hypothetical protein